MRPKICFDVKHGIHVPETFECKQQQRQQKKKKWKKLTHLQVETKRQRSRLNMPINQNNKQNRMKKHTKHKIVNYKIAGARLCFSQHTCVRAAFFNVGRIAESVPNLRIHLICEIRCRAIVGLRKQKLETVATRACWELRKGDFHEIDHALAHRTHHHESLSHAHQKRHFKIFKCVSHIFGSFILIVAISCAAHIPPFAYSWSKRRIDFSRPCFVFVFYEEHRTR